MTQYTPTTHEWRNVSEVLPCEGFGVEVRYSTEGDSPVSDENYSYYGNHRFGEGFSLQRLGRNDGPVQWCYPSWVNKDVAACLDDSGWMFGGDGRRYPMPKVKKKVTT